MLYHMLHCMLDIEKLITFFSPLKVTPLKLVRADSSYYSMIDYNLNSMQIEEAISQDLLENTADPSALSAQDIASASTDLESLGDSALSNPTVRPY